MECHIRSVLMFCLSGYISLTPEACMLAAMTPFTVAMASKWGRHSTTLPKIWPCERASSCGTVFLKLTPLDDESHRGHCHKYTPSYQDVIVIIALVVTLSTSNALLMHQSEEKKLNGSMMYKSVLDKKKIKKIF